MNSQITLTDAQVRALWREDGGVLGLELHEGGDWEDGGKYQYITNIYFQESTGKYFELSISRSGSHFTDWYYSFEDSGEVLNEVKLIERVEVVKSWVPVN